MNPKDQLYCEKTCKTSVSGNLHDSNMNGLWVCLQQVPIECTSGSHQYSQSGLFFVCLCFAFFLLPVKVIRQLVLTGWALFFVVCSTRSLSFFLMVI